MDRAVGMVLGPALAQQLPVAFLLASADGRVTEWNRRAEACFGWPRDAALAFVLSELLSDPLVDERVSSPGTTSQGGWRWPPAETVSPQPRRLQVRHREGHTVTVDASWGWVDAEGQRRFAIFFDLPAVAVHDAPENLRHLQSVTDHVPALISHVNRRHEVTFANATFKSWMDVDPATVVGRPLREMLGDDMYERRKGFLARGLSGETLSFDLSTSVRGGLRDFKTTYIPDVSPEGEVAGVFVLVTDVTAMKEAERQWQRLAQVDTLTGLANRRQFEERLGEALAHAPSGLALMYLDLDRFKSINDSLGHAAGDEVLSQFAMRLAGCVRKTDMVARLAGDEFVVLLQGLATATEATRVADKIHDQMQQPMGVNGTLLQVTASIGIALSQPADTGATLVARADEALYAAKAAGRNRHVVGGGGVDGG